MEKKSVEKEVFYKLYIEEQMSMSEIATELNISKATVQRKLKRFGIPIRDISEVKKGRSNGQEGTLRKDLDKEAIIEAYNDMTSMRQLCIDYNVSYKTLRKYFEIWGVEIRPHDVQTTYHNKVYKTGKNFRPRQAPTHEAPKKRKKNYGAQNKNYHYIYHRVAFSTYPHECCVCGYNEFTEILEVHHIDGDRSNNEPENLIIICPNCHRALTKGLIELKEKVQG